MKRDPKLILEEDKYGRTALHIAAKQGYAEVVEWLLKNGSDPDAVSSSGATALHLARHARVVSRILPYRPDLSKRCPSIGSAIEHAAREFRRSRTLTNRRRWGEILDLYRALPLQSLETDELVILGHVDGLKNRLQELVDPDTAGQLFRIAVTHGRYELVRYFIEELGVSPDYRREDYHTYPIFDSVQHVEVLRLLAKSSSQINSHEVLRIDNKIPYRGSLLHIAARNGTAESVIFLLKNGFDISELALPAIPIEQREYTALGVASASGNMPAAEAIIQSKSFAELDIENRERYLNSSLFLSLQYPDIVSLLLDAGADANTSHNGSRCFRFAAEKVFSCGESERPKRMQSLHIIADNVGNVDVVTAIVLSDHERVASLLKKNRELLEEVDAAGRHLVHMAVWLEDEDMVRVLAEHGADLDSLSEDKNGGQSALYKSVYYSDFTMCSTLIELGAKVNRKNKDGQTPLHASVKVGALNCAQILVKNGAMVTEDNLRNTPISLLSSGRKRLSAQRKSEFRKLFGEQTLKGVGR